VWFVAVKITGPARIALKTDRRHYVHADHAVLEDGVLTALCAYGVRSWPMSEVFKIAWLDCDREQVA
jgi:hypothetical protein